MYIRLKPTKDEDPREFDKALREELASLPDISALYEVRLTDGLLVYKGISVNLRASWNNHWLLPHLYVYTTVELLWEPEEIYKLRPRLDLWVGTHAIYPIPLLNKLYD